MCQAICVGQDDRVLATVPLCHSYGLEHGLLAPVWAGATVHLARGLDLSLVQRELLQSRITLLPAVPSAFEMLGNLAAHGEHFPSLRAAYSAGAPLPMSVSDRFFDRCGVRIGQVFGATEIGSVTYSDPLASGFNPTSVGKPMPGVNISLRNSHLYISAGSMFSGYLNELNPIDTDGFYATGDLAELDNHGNLLITGRSKLLIDVGGLKVNPIEVEQVLIQHPAIAECVVIPVQQSETVVRLKAVFTLRSGSAGVSTEDLRQFARERLAGYKVPRSFEMRDELPRSATGKILRQQIH
jgi:acyl-coenzyme A synthetase/AMP-(fatty) acid ligase